MATREDVLKALSAIIDPDFGKDIVSLGFVKDVAFHDDLAKVTIELTTPACPVKSEFQRRAEQLLLALPGINHVNVNMTSRRQEAANSASGLTQVANIIAVASCKGGVGKSTVAAHLARELAQRGFKTGLLDADLFGPSVPTLFNVQAKGVHVDERKMITPFKIDDIRLMSFGFLLGDGPAVMRGPMVSGYMQQILHQVNWGELDYLIIDMPPGTGDIQLTITQSLRISGAVIVTTRQALSLVDVARGIMMFEKVNVPMLGIVENMAYFTCDDCKKRHIIFGSDADGDAGERFGLDTLARLPVNRSLAEALASEYAAFEDITHMVDATVRALGKRSAENEQLPEIGFDTSHVSINWPDGVKSKIENKQLRAHCRCASCVDEYSGEKTLHDDSIPETIVPATVSPLGNYAVHIAWNDGHDSSIYPYKQLKEICREAELQRHA
ncbi:MAG: P-loop NTPase [Chitinivibrionales bacterium]|nr:P-loop NTPase [Chitinivibrionales bacterium]